MHAVLATDHVFSSHRGRYYDRYCFNEAFFSDYLAAFDRVTVVCRAAPIEDPPEGNALDGERLRFVNVGDRRGAVWQAAAEWLAADAVKQAVAEADAVVARVPSRLGDLAARVAQKQRKPYLIEVFGDPREAFQTRGRGILYRAAALIEARRLRRQARHCAAASYVNRSILPFAYPAKAGVKTETISSIRLSGASIQEPRHYQAAPSPLRLATVASLMPYKRHADLLRAIADARSSGVVCRADFAGDGPERATLERLTAELGLADSVRFRGHLSGSAAVASMLGENDVFALPSATEGLPRAVLEAMSLGMPAIGSDAGGLPELIRKEDTFKVGETASITRLLCSMASDPTRLTEMSTHSIRTARQYTNDLLSPRRVALFENLKQAV
ncbi:glycosyltransferase family 4 protein [Botrimarina sp.]|uniref:glycosyltransferase family 4 protein n=1 Tax=Botrimarina sp. TaxID=2795802 RepID=UPI0032EF775B